MSVYRCTHRQNVFFTLTERKNILKPKALIHIYITCCLRIFCFAWPISTTRAKNRSFNVCYWYLLSIRIRNWKNSIWWPGTDLWSSKTEICQESNKAEIKDKFRSLKITMASTERLLPPGTDRKIKSLNTYLKIKLGDWFLKLRSVNNRNVWSKDNWTRLSLVLVINTPLDCKTVRIFAYSSAREQSNKSSGMRLKTESERRVRLARFARVKLLRHALPISLLILRKKPTVLQLRPKQYTWNFQDTQRPFDWIVQSLYY